MVDSVVVDTDIVSFTFKRDSRANLYEPHLKGKFLVISFMTLAQLYRWARKYRWSMDRRLQMEKNLTEFIIYPYDRALCHTWAEVTQQASEQGRSIEAGDAWIASTALLYNIPLVTHNRKHFIDIPGLTVISEAP